MLPRRLFYGSPSGVDKLDVVFMPQCCAVPMRSQGLNSAPRLRNEHHPFAKENHVNQRFIVNCYCVPCWFPRVYPKILWCISCGPLRFSDPMMVLGNQHSLGHGCNTCGSCCIPRWTSSDAVGRLLVWQALAQARTSIEYMRVRQKHVRTRLIWVFPK